MAIKNLWGEIPDMDSFITPYEILQEQGKILVESTAGMLDYEIQRQQKNTLFSFEFWILVPALSYKYSLVRVTHDIKLYPAILSSEQNGEEFTAKSQEEFEKDLGAILSAEETQILVRSLLAQAKLEASSSS